MKKIVLLKIGSLISFLFIFLPGKLTLPMLIVLILTLLNSCMEFFYPHQDYTYLIYEFLFSIGTIISFYLLFKKNKYLVIFSFLIQLFFLLYCFKSNYLNYWYYTIPILIYFILNVLLIFNLFSKNVELPSGATRNVNGGNSPSNHKGC